MLDSIGALALAEPEARFGLEPSQQAVPETPYLILRSYYPGKEVPHAAAY
jgi:hypothetical protein